MEKWLSKSSEVTERRPLYRLHATASQCCYVWNIVLLILVFSYNFSIMHRWLRILKPQSLNLSYFCTPLLLLHIQFHITPFGARYPLQDNPQVQRHINIHDKVGLRKSCRKPSIRYYCGPRCGCCRFTLKDRPDRLYSTPVITWIVYPRSAWIPIPCQHLQRTNERAVFPISIFCIHFVSGSSF